MFYPMTDITLLIGLGLWRKLRGSTCDRQEVCGVLKGQTLSVSLSNSTVLWPDAPPTNMGKVNVMPINHLGL